MEVCLVYSHGEGCILEVGTFIDNKRETMVVKGELKAARGTSRPSPPPVSGSTLSADLVALA